MQRICSASTVRVQCLQSLPPANFSNLVSLGANRTLQCRPCLWLTQCGRISGRPVPVAYPPITPLRTILANRKPAPTRTSGKIELADLSSATVFPNLHRSTSVDPEPEFSTKVTLPRIPGATSVPRWELQCATLGPFFHDDRRGFRFVRGYIVRSATTRSQASR